MDLSLNKWGKPTTQLSENEQLGAIKSFSDNSLDFYGLITSFVKDEYGLAKINVRDKESSRISLPLMERIRPFKVTFIDGPSKNSVHPSVYLFTEGGRVILSTGISNELYVLDQVADTLQHNIYESGITPAEKSGRYRTEVNSQEEMYATYRSINEEISYAAPFWDAEKELFYRFSYLGKYYQDSDKAVYDITPDNATVFLTIYDKNLMQIRESVVPGLGKVPAEHFAKDGKIWIFENIEDEMGFVRLSFEL